VDQIPQAWHRRAFVWVSPVAASYDEVFDRFDIECFKGGVPTDEYEDAILAQAIQDDMAEETMAAKS
jgi:hypothetical protein